MLKKILVNSQDRLSGTPQEFNVKLPIRNTKKIDSLMVSKAMIPNTWYNIQNKAIVLYYPSTNRTESISIPDGNYTISSLITKINQIFATTLFENMNITFHATTLTYDCSIGKIYFWNSVVIPLDYKLDATASNSILKFLNFSGLIALVSQATPLSVIVATSGFVNISPNNYVMIKSSALRHQETYEPETTNPNDFNSVIATIPITTNFGELIVYNNTDTENMIKYASHIPNQIDIKLSFYNNEPAYINTEWTFELVIKYE